MSPLPRNVEAALRDASHAKVEVRLSALADLGRWATGAGGARVVDKLLDVLRADSSPQVRARAAVALADADARRALPRLVEALGDPETGVRQMVVLALGELGSKSEVDVVRALLDDPSAALRFQALVALHHLSAGVVDDVLPDKFSDPDPEVRFVALRIAEERFVGAQRAAPPWLSERLEEARADVAPHVRLLAAIVSYHAFGDTDQQVLADAISQRTGIRELEDEQAAIEIAGELRLKQAVPGLERRAFGWFGISRDPFAWQAKVALARMGHPRAVSTILSELRAWTWETRTMAAAAAGAARLAPARARLLAMLGDEPSANQDTVRDALSQIDQG